MYQCNEMCVESTKRIVVLLINFLSDLDAYTNVTDSDGIRAISFQQIVYQNYIDDPERLWLYRVQSVQEVSTPRPTFSPPCLEVQTVSLTYVEEVSGQNVERKLDDLIGNVVVFFGYARYIP